jgi:hypothetical protein
MKYYGIVSNNVFFHSFKLSGKPIDLVGTLQRRSKLVGDS